MSWAALVIAILPFFVSFSSSSSTIVNGVVVESSHIDYVALICGGIALLLGGMALLLSRKKGVDLIAEEIAADLPKPSPLIALGVPVAALGLGVFQILRGTGMI